MKNISAVRYSERGDPASVGAIRSIELREPQQGEVLVRMLYAPINPSDINTLEGTYGALRPLPDTPGNEGIGIVESVGPSVEVVSIGMHVLVGSMTWCEAGIWKAEDLIILDKVLDPVQGAMIRINAPSAYCMLKSFHSFQSGEWVAQNASNSGVGRWVMALAKRWNIPAIHLVRRGEVLEELKSQGYEHVILDDEHAVESAKKISGSTKFPLALNAVGGESAGRLTKMLGFSGQLITYGAMSRQAFRVSNGALIFKDISYRGFWVHKYVGRMTVDAQAAMYAELMELSNSGAVKIPVDEIFPLAKFADAIQAAMKSGRSGKIVLKLS
ncbi:MAG: 2-enoyl thioester reductase domain-containing protein [Chthoniobacterales bacterium]